MTLSIKDIHRKALNVGMLSVIQQCVIMLCRHVECRYAECRYTECRGAQKTILTPFNFNAHFKDIGN